MSTLTEGKTRAYQAYAKGCTSTADTPRAAARKFFDTFKGKRKCSVIQGWADGQCFTVIYGRRSDGQWPDSWKDVTPKTIASLPEA